MYYRKFLIVLFLVILIRLTTGVSHAATYYLSPAGSDTNQGTQASPWKTISKANSSIASGDTVILADGTYSAYVKINKPNSIWKALNKHKAVIDGGLSPTLLNGQWNKIVPAYNEKCSGMGTWVNLITVDTQNVTIDGLFLKNSCGRGVLLNLNSSGAIFKNNWVDWTMQAGVFVSAETNGIQFTGNYMTRNSFGDVYRVLTTGDYSVNISAHMSGNGMVVRDNVFAWGRGEIAMTGARNLLVEKNFILGNKNNFYPGWAQNVVFRNNLVYAPESRNTSGTHWEKVGDSTHNWHMSTRNEKTDRWSDYVNGLDNIAYYNNIIINNEIGFSGYHRAGGAFVYSTDTTKLYFGYNTVIAGPETGSLLSANFGSVEGEDSKLTGIVENNVFDTRKNPGSKVGVKLSGNDQIVLRNNIIPNDADNSFSQSGNIRNNNPGLINSAASLSIVPPPIGVDVLDMSEILNAVQILDYLPQTNGISINAAITSSLSSDTIIPAEARSVDFLRNSRDTTPDIGALEYGSEGTGEPPVDGTRLGITAYLHGIGNGGDNVMPSSPGNNNPLHSNRGVTIELFNSQNQSQGLLQGNISYNSSGGNFQGVIDAGNTPGGIYTARIRSLYYLSKAYSGVINITQDQLNQLAPVYLVAGDANNDNSLSILDFNIILDCYSELEPPRNCNDADKRLSADLTDDGDVNQFDYNLFLRELSVQVGDDDTTPQPTSPAATNTPPQGATNTPVPTNPPGGGDGEIKLFDEIVQFTSSDNGFHRLHEGNSPWPAHVPVNWKEPVDYFNTQWQYRIQVIANPTNQASKLQLCFWKIPGFDPENCAFNISQTGIGIYTYASNPSINGANNGGWARISGTVLSFTDPETYRASIILRGPGNCVVTTKGQVANKCPELFDRLKDMRFKLTVIMVPAGQSFSGWGNY